MKTCVWFSRFQLFRDFITFFFAASFETTTSTYILSMLLFSNMEPNIYNRNGSTYSDELAAAFYSLNNATFLIDFMKQTPSVYTFSSNVTLGFIIILLAFSPFLWWYCRLNGKAISNSAAPKNGKKPEQVPYLFPLIVNAISYLLDAAGVAESITQIICSPYTIFSASPTQKIFLVMYLYKNTGSALEHLL